jgi:hypothetical protein
MTSAIRANCSREHFPAYHHSGTRALHDIWWIVLHDEEAPTAQSAAAYFELRQSGGSSQLAVDQFECFRCLLDDAVPWGASSAAELAANTHGFHIEQAGYARWLPGQWLLHSQTIERAAFKTAQTIRRLESHGAIIPVQWRTAAELVHGAQTGHPARGITTHREITAASKVLDPTRAWRYTHTDPGLFYPRRRFMTRCQAYYAELG